MIQDDPPPEFDARWYRDAHPDVDLVGLSAEDHWALIGRHIGRPPRGEAAPRGDGYLVDLVAAVATLPRPPRMAPAAGADGAGAPGGPGRPPIVEAPPGLGSRRASADPRAEAPRARQGGRSVRLRGVEVAVVGDGEEPAPLWPVLAAFCALHGLSPEAALTIEGAGDAGLPAAAVAGDGRPGPLIGPPLRQGPHAVVDLWFATTHHLRLAFGGGSGDGTSDGTPEEAAGEAVEDAAVRLFQLDPRAGLAVVGVGGGPLAAEGPTFLDAGLRNPLLPVLVELSGPGGATRALGLLPFPSLARGGPHAAEVAALAWGDGSPATLWAYAEARLGEWLGAGSGRPGRLRRVAVALDGATGAELIFSDDVARWLDLLGVEVAPAARSAASDLLRLDALLPARRAGASDGPLLILPPDALPTVAALTAPFGPAPHGTSGGAPRGPAAEASARPRAVAHLVAERGTGRPLWAIATAAGDDDLGPLQPGPDPFPTLRGPGPRAAGLPLAVVLRDPRPVTPLELLVPSAPDRPALPAAPPLPGSGPLAGVACVLAVRDAREARAFLATLAAQDAAEGLRVAAHGDAAAAAALAPDLERLFPGRHLWLDAAAGPLGPDALLRAGEGRALLLAEDRMLLHDPRTLGALRAMLATGRTASAACVTLYEEQAGRGTTVRTEAGGFFPARVGLVGGAHLLFDTPDTLPPLPSATYPVVANALSLALIHPAALAEAAPQLRARGPELLGPALRGPDSLGFGALEFGLAALGGGWRHLCTSAVRAGSSRPRRRPAWSDPVALRALAPARWEDLLSRVTLLRELC